MSHSIRAGMAHSGGNSLSPEPCALIPVPSKTIHDLSPSARATRRGLWITRPGIDFRGRPLPTRHGRSLVLPAWMGASGASDSEAGYDRP